MKVSVCFKIVPDYDQVPKDEWKGGLSLPDFRYVKKIIGVFDEGALETALCLKDVLPDTVLEAVSVGRPNSIFTESIYAAGFDKVTYLKNAGSEFDPSNTARVLLEYFKSSDTDLILCGEQVGPADSGTVPYFLASLMNIPVVDRVSELYVSGGKVMIKRETDDSTQSFLCDRRMLAVVSSAAKPYLRFAEYSKKVEAGRKKADVRHIVTFPQFSHAVFRKKKAVKKNTVFLKSASEIRDLISGGGI